MSATDNTYYCMNEHRRVVEHELFAMGLRLRRDSVRGVDGRATQIRGVRAGTFVVIEGHPVPVARDVWDALEIYGFNVIKFDDSRARAMAMREMERHEQQLLRR